MLHAALIGFPSTGKSTLFQLMTSAKDAPRGKGERAIGISKVPDDRLDKLTAMFNPKKTRPGDDRVHRHRRAGPTAAPPRSSTSPATRMPMRCVHVVRAFRDPAVPHPSGSVDPARDAQAMEDELILADLGVVERRLERMEKDLKKNKSAELEKEKELLLQLQGRARERPAAARARPRRRRSAAAARLPAAVGQATAGRDQSR